MTVSAEAAQHAPTSWTTRGLFTVIFLGITAGVQMSDMGLQAISLSAIQGTFGVGDTALGALQGLAGVLVGSALAIPLARFADRFSRKRVLLCLIVASTAMMVLSALAPNFPLFFIGRSAAGITEFAMVPLVYSMIPDLAPERHRVAANLGFAALVAAGASGGFYFAGNLLALAAEWSPLPIAPWRNAFLLLSLAGLPLMLLGPLTTNPPRHTGKYTDAATQTLKAFLRERRRALCLFAGAAGCMVVGVQAINHLISLALERRFGAEPGDIGNAMGIIVLVSAMGCLPLAGVLDRLLAPRFGRADRPLIMATCTVAATPILVLLATVGRFDQALAVVAVTLFITNTANALVPTMLQDLTPPLLRARSFAIWSFVVSVFGAAGPLLAGTLSDRVFDGDLVSAITVTAGPALVVSAYCAIRLFVHTRAQLEATVRRYAAPRKGPQ